MQQLGEEARVMAKTFALMFNQVNFCDWLDQVEANKKLDFPFLDMGEDSKKVSTKRIDNLMNRMKFA